VHAGRHQNALLYEDSHRCSFLFGRIIKGTLSFFALPLLPPRTLYIIIDQYPARGICSHFLDGRIHLALSTRTSSSRLGSTVSKAISNPQKIGVKKQFPAFIWHLALDPFWIVKIFMAYPKIYAADKINLLNPRVFFKEVLII
jgi:hypothetical protein